jgi:hypothetical protein
LEERLKSIDQAVEEMETGGEGNRRMKRAKRKQLRGKNRKVNPV